MNKATKTILVIIFISLIGVVLKIQVIDRIQLDRDHKTTIAKIVDLKGVSNGAPTYIYEFKVEGKTYRSSYKRDPRYNIQIGYCYYVEYYSKNPNNCRMLIDRQTVCE